MLTLFFEQKELVGIEVTRIFMLPPGDVLHSEGNTEFTAWNQRKIFFMVLNSQNSPLEY
jgi:hypothetical protein